MLTSKEISAMARSRRTIMRQRQRQAAKKRREEIEGPKPRPATSTERSRKRRALAKLSAQTALNAAVSSPLLQPRNEAAASSVASTKLEVLVDFGPKIDEQVLDKTLKELKSYDGVTEALFKDGAIMVETTLPSTAILNLVSQTSGKRAVLQGFGETQSAVSMVSSQSCCKGGVIGVIRFQQSAEGPLVADGCIDGLTPGPHGLHVHEVGDLSQGCKSIGGRYNPDCAHGAPSDPSGKRHAGDLGNVVADESGRATFRIVDEVLKVWDIIGRSVAVTERGDDLGKGNTKISKEDGDSGSPVACGIIARSAGIFQNPKRICACDGVVVWDEKDRPLVGKGRRDKACCQKEKQDGVKPCCRV